MAKKKIPFKYRPKQVMQRQLKDRKPPSAPPKRKIDWKLFFKKFANSFCLRISTPLLSLRSARNAAIPWLMDLSFFVKVLFLCDLIFGCVENFVCFLHFGGEVY